MVRFRPEAPFWLLKSERCSEIGIARSKIKLRSTWQFGKIYMREWLSGRASPCQGERREFESRLPLHLQKTQAFASFVLNNLIWHHSQVVRQRSATPLPPVQVWVVPPRKIAVFRVLKTAVFVSRKSEPKCCVLLRTVTENSITSIARSRSKR